MEKQKECFKCRKTKYLSEFYKHPQMPDGRVNKCKDCNKVENKENWWKRREEKLDYDKNRHRYSIPRIFNHRYAGIKTRCKGIGRTYTVTGMKYLSKSEWKSWCYEPDNMKKFMNYYNKWMEAGFSNKTAPSIDRIDSSKGYIVGNLQWLSQSENCSKYNK